MCSREPSKQHILAALARSLDRRWFLAGGSLPLGALVRSAAMAAHPGKYGHVNAAQFLKLLPAGGSNRRYSKEMPDSSSIVAFSFLQNEHFMYYTARPPRSTPSSLNTRPCMRLPS